MVFHPTGKDQHSPELPPVQDETEYRGQQAHPAPQAQAAQLLAGVGLDEEDGGQQLPVPQALQQEAAEVVAAGALGV